MVAAFLSPLYLSLWVYLMVHLSHWLGAFHAILTARAVSAVLFSVLGVVAFSPVIGAFAPSTYGHWGRVVNNHWLIPFFYLVTLCAVCDAGCILVNVVNHRAILAPLPIAVHRAMGVTILALVLAMCIYGTIHACIIKATIYDVQIEKSTTVDGLTIALVADLHLGTNIGVAHVQRMCKVLEDMQPDLVVYAGDIFDNDYDAVVNPDCLIALLSNLRPKYGSYACWGNHDVAEKILGGFTFSNGKHPVQNDPRMKTFFDKAGISLLEDEIVLIEDAFYLVGRLDASSFEKSRIVRKTPRELMTGLDMSKPIFVIDHQPKELEELADSGVDLTLSGHTHQGQMFPGNLTIGLFWKNARGMIRVGNMTDIVTSGAGVWGPAMRIGTDAEVVGVRVTFS